MILQDKTKFELDSFLIFFLIWCHVAFKFWVFHLQQTNFASYEESTGSPARGLFYLYCLGVVELVT